MEKKLTLIIAESQSFDRRTLELYAERMNLKVVSSLGSGKWLIEDCLRLKPDLVFLDFNLKGIDGVTAYKNILEQGLNPYLIIVSGTEDYSLVLAGLELNCLDYVTKPITFARLYTAVEKARLLIKKDIHFTNKPSGKIIRIKSNSRSVFIHEDRLIYAQKIKGVHKTILYVEGEKETGIETTASLIEIQSQCSKIIYAPNQSNLINLNYIHSMFASYDTLGNYAIRLTFNDIDISLARRKKKEFEQIFAEHNK